MQHILPATDRVADNMVWSVAVAEPIGWCDVANVRRSTVSLIYCCTAVCTLDIQRA